MAELPAVPADGNVKVVLVTTIADTAAPTVAELNAVTSVDISCYLTSDGFTPSLNEQVIADERLCSTATYEQPGRSQRSLDVVYIDNTNTAEDNDAKDTLVPGVAQYLVVRRGIAFDTTFVATTQKVSVWPIKPGQYSDLPPEANSVLKTAQKLFVTGEVTVDVAVAA
jgi:hypothetical protein